MTDCAELKTGQPVWLKTPKLEEAKVVPRSINVETSTGVKTRRNRARLRLGEPGRSIPGSTLPTESETTNFPDTDKHSFAPVPSYEVIPKPAEAPEATATTIVKTRSGRVVKQ